MQDFTYSAHSHFAEYKRRERHAIMKDVVKTLAGVALVLEFGFFLIVLAVALQ